MAVRQCVENPRVHLSEKPEDLAAILAGFGGLFNLDLVKAFLPVAPREAWE